MKAAVLGSLALCIVSVIGCGKPATDSTASTSPAPSPSNQSPTSFAGQPASSPPQTSPSTTIRPAQSLATGKDKGPGTKNRTYSLVGRWKQLDQVPPGGDVHLTYKPDGTLDNVINIPDPRSKYKLVIHASGEYKLDGSNLTQKFTSASYASEDPTKAKMIKAQNDKLASQLKDNKQSMHIDVSWIDKDHPVFQVHRQASPGVTAKLLQVHFERAS